MKLILKRSSKIALICLTASIILSSCDKFPTKYIYIKSLTDCSRVEIIDENPLKFGSGVIVDNKDCPTVYGFAENDAGNVTDWIRRNQKKTCSQ